MSSHFFLSSCIINLPSFHWMLPRWCSGKESACQCRRCKRHVFDPWVGKIPWRRKWQPTPGLLPGESHGQRSLAGCSLWGCKDSDTTLQLSMLVFTNHLIKSMRYAQVLHWCYGELKRRATKGSVILYPSTETIVISWEKES